MGCAVSVLAGAAVVDRRRGVVAERFLPILKVKDCRKVIASDSVGNRACPGTRPASESRGKAPSRSVVMKDLAFEHCEAVTPVGQVKLLMAEVASSRCRESD